MQKPGPRAPAFGINLAVFIGDRKCYTGLIIFKIRLKCMPESKPVHTKDIEDNKAVAAIGYLWILFLVPLLTKKDSPFAQFHARQGMILFISWIVIWLVGWVPVLGWIIGFLGSLAIAILSIIGFLKALQGEQWELPVLGEYARKLKI